MDEEQRPKDELDDFIEHLELPEVSCDQVHPVVEEFLEDIDPENDEWTGEFSDWMEQANSCLTSEILDVLGDPPTDEDEAEDYVWSVIRLSWLFYRKFHDGAPFNS